MKNFRAEYAFCVLLLMATGAALLGADLQEPQEQSPPVERPMPARDRFVEVFQMNPLVFNARFVRAIDAETTATAAQRYAVVKELILLEEQAGARNLPQLFMVASPALKLRLKTVTAGALAQAKAEAQVVVSALDVKTSEALSAE